MKSLFPINKLLPSLRGRGWGVGPFLLFLFIFSSCRPQLPEGVISEGKMERVLYDYHMAQGVAENTPPDSGSTDVYRYELIQAVYRKHGITEEQFEKSMTFYCSDLQRLNKIYKRLQRRYEREAHAYGQSTVRDVYANLSADGDTANVWGGRPLMITRSKIEENVLTWQQECDSTWQPGDQLLWRFMPVALVARSFRSFVADLVVYYDNDSIRGAMHHGTTGQQLELRVTNPEGWTPVAVAGHLYQSVSRETQDLSVVAATQIMLIRIHDKQRLAKLAAADSVATDSVSADSLATDSFAVRRSSSDERRRSPEEFRRQQDVDQRTDIVKEKPYVQPQRGGRRRMQQQHIVPQRRNNNRRQ